MSRQKFEPSGIQAILWALVAVRRAKATAPKLCLRPTAEKVERIWLSEDELREQLEEIGATFADEMRNAPPIDADAELLELLEDLETQKEGENYER